MKQDKAWRGYLWVRRAHIGSILLLLLSTGLLFGRKHLEFPETAGDQIVVSFVLPLMITALFSAFISQWWPCPRCKKAFFIGWYGAIPFIRTCRHCGLEKWAEPDDDIQSSGLEPSMPDVDEYWKSYGDG